MSYFEALKYGITQEPDIVNGANESYVIIGSHDHGMQIPKQMVPKLVQTLDGIVALKMEGEGMETAFNRFHPMSVELLAKASIDPSRLFWIAESDGEDIGQKLAKYGVSEGIMEVFVPSLSIRMHRGIPEGFFTILPLAFEYYKSRFGFLNTEHGVESFRTVADYWRRHQLDPMDLAKFAYDFEMFMGNVRGFDYWRPDLRRFRTDYTGKIAVCVGVYHVPFVQSVLEGREIEKPDWPNHISKNYDPYVVERRDLLKEIYRNIEAALNPPF